MSSSLDRIDRALSAMNAKRIRLTNSQLCVLIDLGLDRQISRQPTHRPAFTDADLDELLAKLPTRYNVVCSTLRKKLARLRYSK